MFTYKKLWSLLTVVSLLLVSSCKEKVDIINPSQSPTSLITNSMARELPINVLNKIKLIESSKFINLNRSVFGSKQSVEEVIKKLNQLNTSKTPVGQYLQLQPISSSRARIADEDPPSRSVTFTSNSGPLSVFDGRVSMNYNSGSSGQPTDISFTSQVTVTAFGANFGSYTQTNSLTNSYSMGDGSVVVAFQVQGTYTPPLVAPAGLSNDWVFNGYLIFPGLPAGGVEEWPIRGQCNMQIYESQ